MNFKRTAALVATTSMAFGLAGCGRDMAPTVPGMNNAGNYNAMARRKAEKGGKWTVLVQMAAENNLYRFGLEDLNEMEAGLPTDGSVDVYVLFDGIKDGDSAIYHVKKDTGVNGDIVSEKVSAPDVIPASNEIDSGDAAISAKFVAWAGKNAPADHTAISFWDHGSGLFHGAPNPITKGFCWDDNGSNHETADLTPIGNAFKSASGKPFAFVGFDACLMAHGEIAYQLAGLSDYLVASEELEPGKGWDYNGWLKSIGGTNRTPAAVASAVVDSYGTSYAPGGSQTSGRDEITLSAVDINAFTGNVIPALNAFVTAANANMPAEKAAFQAARNKTQMFYNRDCGDLGNFMANLKATSKNAALKAATDKLTAAVGSAVIRETHSKKFTGATGMVLYFPTPTQSINSSYTDPAKIAFAATEWKSFLKNYK